MTDVTKLLEEAENKLEWASKEYSDTHGQHAPVFWKITPWPLVERLAAALRTAREEAEEWKWVHEATTDQWHDRESDILKERDEAREELQDWRESVSRVMAEDCDIMPDAVHCTCVPILRGAISALCGLRDEARREATEARDDMGRTEKRMATVCVERDRLFHEGRELRKERDEAVGLLRDLEEWGYDVPLGCRQDVEDFLSRIRAPKKES